LAGHLKSRRYLRYIEDLCTELKPYGDVAEVRAFRGFVAENYPTLLAS
jgi:hypothetical protein